MMRIKPKRLAVLLLAPTLFILGAVAYLALRWSGTLWKWGLAPRRALHSVQRGSDLADCSVAGLDLRDKADIVISFGFNQRTRWPPTDKMPPGFDPGEVLTNAMNPGLGVRELHRQGITGKGVSVAIIDYSLLGRHPEFAEKLREIHSVGGASGASMHGPAVASLLAGQHCGVAPDARVYFLATPDPGGDARWQAEALDWILEKNQVLSPAEKIRVVSVSASPSGPGSTYRNGAAWDQAVARAEMAGVLVVDGTLHHGFLAPCNLDSKAPDDPSRCTPIPTQRGLKTFAGRLLVPVAPRTIAYEFTAHSKGYRYCGWMDQTHGLFGTSWSMPYCAGVLALGCQVNPHVPAERMKQLLLETGLTLPSGEKVINPPAFVAAVKREPAS